MQVGVQPRVHGPRMRAQRRLGDGRRRGCIGGVFTELRGGCADACVEDGQCEEGGGFIAFGAKSVGACYSSTTKIIIAFQPRRDHVQGGRAARDQDQAPLAPAFQDVHVPVAPLAVGVAVPHHLARTLLQVLCGAPAPGAHFVEGENDGFAANEFQSSVPMRLLWDRNQRHLAHAMVKERKDQLLSDGGGVGVSQVQVESHELVPGVLAKCNGCVDELGVVADPLAEPLPVEQHHVLDQMETEAVAAPGTGPLERFDHVRTSGEREYWDGGENLIGDTDQVLKILLQANQSPEGMGCENFLQNDLILWTKIHERTPAFAFGVQRLASCRVNKLNQSHLNF